MSQRSRTLRTLLGGVRRRVVGDRPVAGHPAERALVETFTRPEIAGWLLVPPDAPECRVSLCLNEIAATEVVAHPEAGLVDGLQRRRFRFALYDFWRFARTTDTVSVRYQERPILLAARKSYGYRPKSDGLSSPAELIKLLETGHIFGQGGKIQLGKSSSTPAGRTRCCGCTRPCTGTWRPSSGCAPSSATGPCSGTFVIMDSSTMIATSTAPTWPCTPIPPPRPDS